MLMKKVKLANLKQLIDADFMIFACLNLVFERNWYTGFLSEFQILISTTNLPNKLNLISVKYFTKSKQNHQVD
jgi:hypothetical protein